jgi:hypothetical protein
MTIFDVIRYPIHIPPLVGELAALPEALYKYWIDFHTIDWHNVDAEIKYAPSNVEEWMRDMVQSHIEDNRGFTHSVKELTTDLEKLRKLIQEYEE